MRSPDGRDLDLQELTRLLACYEIRLEPTREVESLDAALAAGEELGWDVVLKATAERLRNRPDLTHVWRNIRDPERMKSAWSSLNEPLSHPREAGFRVQRNAPPGVPIAIASLEDPLFGPVVSFSTAGPLTELLADRAYGIPPLNRQDASEMVRAIKSSPLLFGYRGADIVDVAEVERLIVQVARLQNDLPQVRSLELSLVLAGVSGCSVLSASARVEPVVDPRSDWFVRRLSAVPGDTGT